MVLKVGHRRGRGRGGVWRWGRGEGHTPNPTIASERPNLALSNQPLLILPHTTVYGPPHVPPCHHHSNPSHTTAAFPLETATCPCKTPTGPHRLTSSTVISSTTTTYTNARTPYSNRSQYPNYLPTAKATSSNSSTGTALPAL